MHPHALRIPTPLPPERETRRFSPLRVGFFATVCLCILLAAPMRVAAAPLLRIIFTAETLGYMHLCASCGAGAQGGIARRVALVNKLARETPASLIIAGPHEFYPDRDTTTQAAPEQSRALAAIHYAAMRAIPYDVIQLSPEAREWFKKNGQPAFPNALTPAADTPLVHTLRKGQLRVALVFLPQPRKENFRKEWLNAALMHCHTARAQADLVIAISPWGMMAENRAARDLAGAADIILGAGQGVPLPGQPTGTPTAPGPFWVRADRLGRGVNVVDILSLPTRGEPWIEGVTIAPRMLFLETSMPEDAATAKLLQALPRDIE